MAVPAPAAVLRHTGARVFALAATVALGGAAFAYGVSVLAPVRQPSPASAGTSAGTVRDLALEDGGLARPLGRGEWIEVTKDLSASLTLVEGGDGHDVLVVRLRDAAGAPVGDATLRAVAEMRYMDHGRAEAVGLPTAPGAYAVPVALAMPGEWRIVLTGTRASATFTLRLDFDDFR